MRWMTLREGTERSKSGQRCAQLVERARLRRGAFFPLSTSHCESQMLNSMMMTRGMDRRERGSARGSVVDESRMFAAKILVTPHQGYLVHEQLQKNISDLGE